MNDKPVAPPKKVYIPPKVVEELDLETKAGSCPSEDPFLPDVRPPC